MCFIESFENILNLSEDKQLPKNPKLSFGKKCVDKQENVVYSYVWLYNKEDGLQANKETCNLIKD